MIYDCAIVGGGLAGLSLALLLRQQGYSVILFEKKKFPFHRVCGEYISMESWDFLKRLGIGLEHMALPKIKRLHVSASNGRILKTVLKMGGFGISRFKMDYLLYQKAKIQGVEILEQQIVKDIKVDLPFFKIKTLKDQIKARLAIGSFGKQSNLDRVLKRSYLKKKNKLKNFIGIKYHVNADLPSDLIELHNFCGGYCGISKIEEGKYCMCYLTTTENLKYTGGSIEKMEAEILSQNPYLNHYFSKFERLYNKPLIISQIDFSKKRLIEQEIPMVGDAAGLIAPLCGNGMSMAFRGSDMLSRWLGLYLSEKIDYPTLMYGYGRDWQSAFSKRLLTGRVLQSILKNSSWTNQAIYILEKLPFLTKQFISLTHGKSF